MQIGQAHPTIYRHRSNPSSSDATARDYLPHLYGAVNWALVDDVRKLPLKVSDIYRRLTL